MCSSEALLYVADREALSVCGQVLALFMLLTAHFSFTHIPPALTSHALSNQMNWICPVVVSHQNY